jgi:hypothetical protein
MKRVFFLSISGLGGGGVGIVEVASASSLPVYDRNLLVSFCYYPPLSLY